MKISQYMQYLKILHDRYGDIEVKIKTTYETMGDRGFAYSNKYKDAVRPRYDKEGKSIVIRREIVSYD